MGTNSAPPRHGPTLTAENGTAGDSSAVIDEIREILLGNTLRNCRERLAETETLIAHLNRDMATKFSDLEETPWADLRTAISALCYRFDVLDRRFGELDEYVRDRLVKASSMLDAASAFDERLRAIEDKIKDDG